jgi:hypothetical protein
MFGRVWLAVTIGSRFENTKAFCLSTLVPCAKEKLTVKSALE